MTNTLPILVIGGTGYLGGKVISALLNRGYKVRAMVRSGTHYSHISRHGVEVVWGDLLDKASLDKALIGVDAVVTSAAGYNKRRATDNSDADTKGFENLAKAVQQAGTRRLVLTGVLKSELAHNVPHFRHKQAQEYLLESMGVPFVSIRPGSFLNQSKDFFSQNIRKGKLIWFGSENVPMSWISTEDVAKYLAIAVDVEGIEGQRIEVGLDRNLSPSELKDVIEKTVNKPIKLKMIPWWLVNNLLAIAGLFKEGARDFRENFAFFQTGHFTIKDSQPQTLAFGTPPSAEEAIKLWLTQSGVINESETALSTSNAVKKTN